MMSVSLRHARVRYGPLEALHGVCLSAPASGPAVLLGRNGSGRTTVLRAPAGTVPLSGGAVVWDGADATRMPAYERAPRGMCLVPDRQAVFGSLTVRENLELAAPDIAAALEVYPRLKPLLPRRAGTLSGGEQRMVALSRVLTSPARLLLLDEFGLGLAEEVVARVHEALAALVAAGRTVLLAEQSLPETAAWDYAYELRRGDVVAVRERPLSEA